HDGTRMSALWGTGGRRGDSARNNSRTGRGGAALVGLVVAAVLALTVPFASFAAGPPTPPPPGAATVQSSIYIPATLLGQAQASGQQLFDVIVQGDGSANAGKVAQKVAQFAADANHKLADAAKKADDAVTQAQNALNDATKRAAD